MMLTCLVWTIKLLKSDSLSSLSVIIFWCWDTIMYKNSHEHVHINVTKMKQPSVFYVFSMLKWKINIEKTNLKIVHNKLKIQCRVWKRPFGIGQQKFYIRYVFATLPDCLRPLKTSPSLTWNMEETVEDLRASYWLHKINWKTPCLPHNKNGVHVST